MRLFLIRYKTFVLALVLLSISLFNMSQKIETDKIYFRSYFYSIFFTLETTMINAYTSLTDVFANAKNIRELEDQIEDLEQEVLYYKELSRLYTHLQQENEQLQSMLHIKNQMQFQAHYSKVIFRDPSLLSDYLIIDKGFYQGIRINMPVVYSVPDSENLILVGKTIEVGPNYSRVRVITAKNFYVGVKSEITGVYGVLKGKGAWNQNLALEYIPVEAQLNIGESIVTSGGSDIYPEGLHVGEIQGIGQNVMEEFFQVLYIKSEFEYNKISEVFILEYEQTYPDFAVGEEDEGV